VVSSIPSISIQTVNGTLEQAFEIRLELRPVLALLGEARAWQDRLREAEALAERLNDDRRRGRVRAFMALAHLQLGEQDEALVTGARALEAARRLDDSRPVSSPRLGWAYQALGRACLRLGRPRRGAAPG
jgi:tetratricopeptide (TPR) repeat protein